MNDRKVGIGFLFALNGFTQMLKTERNFRIHLVVMVLVIITSAYFRLSAIEWILIIISICFVLITEMINSAIEKMIDYFKPDVHPTAKIIKDIGAGAVLIASMMSVIIGLFIFLPKIINLF